MLIELDGIPVCFVVSGEGQFRGCTGRGIAIVHEGPVRLSVSRRKKVIPVSPEPAPERWRGGAEAAEKLIGQSGSPRLWGEARRLRGHGGVDDGLL
jgi:hypothetical protein